MHRITGKTKLLGVIGWPVEHTRSPGMQAAAIESAGLNYTYVPLAVHPDRVGEAVHGLRALGFRGVNVTIPHKQAVIPFLDELSPVARAIGAVNTITVESDGRIVGDNTDADGALIALEEETGISVQGAEVAVIGAGGAGRAAAFGAAARGAARLVLLNRSRERAQEVAGDIRRAFPKATVEVPASAGEAGLERCRVFLQMTSLGMKEGDPLPLDPQLVPPEAVGLEAVYAPLETPWRQACLERGCRIVDGLAMLVGQGARAFEIWTGKPADRDAMRKALMRD